MARKRKNLTFSPEILARAEAVMQARGFDELSDFCSALIREEYERRHATGLANSPPVGPNKEALAQVLGVVKKHHPLPKQKLGTHPKAQK